MSGICIGWDAVGAIATAAGACFIWHQISQVQKQIKLQNYSNYTKRYQEIVLNFPEEINEPKFELSELGLGKRCHDKTMRYMRSYFDLSFEEWNLHERKLIDPDTWKVWEGGIRTALKKPAFQQGWMKIKNSGTDYGAEFECIIEDYIRKTKQRA